MRNNIGDKRRNQKQKSDSDQKTNKDIQKKKKKYQKKQQDNKLEYKQRQRNKMQINRNKRTLYKKSFSFILMISMCVIGYSKVQFILYLLTQYYLMNEDDGVFTLLFAQFFGGIGITILLLIKFNYNWSRRLIILLAECSFTAGLALINWDVGYQFILLGFSSSLSLFIYPLYLFEQSYDKQYANLANYLQYSFFIGTILIRFFINSSFFPFPDYEVQEYTFQLKTLLIILMCISIFNGLLVNYGIEFKETIMSLYMRNREDKGNQIISKLIKEDEENVKNYFIALRTKRQQQNNYIPIDNPDLLSQKRKKIQKNIKILILSFLIPFTYIFLYEQIFQFTNILKIDDNICNLIIVPSIAFILSCTAFIICFYVKHNTTLKRGFQLSFFISIVWIIEHMMQDQLYYQFYNYVCLVCLIVLFCTVSSVWKVKVFSTLNIKWIWIHQLVFWFSIFLFYVMMNLQNQFWKLISQSCAILFGYLLINFF